MWVYLRIMQLVMEALDKIVEFIIELWGYTPARHTSSSLCNNCNIHIYIYIYNKNGNDFNFQKHEVNIIPSPVSSITAMACSALCCMASSAAWRPCSALSCSCCSSIFFSRSCCFRMFSSSSFCSTHTPRPWEEGETKISLEQMTSINLWNYAIATTCWGCRLS